MAFDYPINLDLAGRATAVFGGGPLAVERVTGLLESGARVVVVTPDPDDRLWGRAGRGEITLRHRTADPQRDLDGAFLAIATREDDAPIEALWQVASATGVLFAALDDVAHCMFGAMSQVRRGDLRITVSTGGRAPALSKRIRKDLEAAYDERYGELVDVLSQARDRALPRQVPFDQWASRWEAALDDLQSLVQAVGEDRRDDVIASVLRHIDPRADDALTAS